MIKELLTELENKLTDADKIVAKLNELGHDFNRKDGGFDFKTNFKNIHGQLIEVKYANIITNPDKKRYIAYEVKSEGPNAWMRTGNIFIEYQQKKKGQWVDSGISITDADFWVHVLKDENGDILYYLELPVSTLLDRISVLAPRTGFNASSDGNDTKGYLVPLNELYWRNIDYKLFLVEQEWKKKNKI